jgi:hypothetical protein
MTETTLESDNQSCTRDKIRIILRMMGAASELPNPSPKWQDLAIQKLNRHGNSIFGETKKKNGISTQEPGRIASFPNTLVKASCLKKNSTQLELTYSLYFFSKKKSSLHHAFYIL